MHPIFDDKRVSGKVQKDFDLGCQIYIYKDEWELNEDDSQHTFSVWIEYGCDKDKTIMLETKLDDLEMFANALTKSIEMFRRDYADVIKERIKRGANI